MRLEARHRPTPHFGPRHADASVVAVAVRSGGGVILTGDQDDLAAIADGLFAVTIESV